MINKIDFKVKKLTSNAGLFLLLDNAIFEMIENDLVFESDSVNKNIIYKIEGCSVDNLQSLISIFAPKMQSIIYRK